MPAFRTGQKVTVASDLSNPPKIGTIVRLVREDRIEGLEGVLETKEIYLVRWMIPSSDGEQPYDQEHAGETLRLWRATKAAKKTRQRTEQLGDVAYGVILVDRI